jgi:D-alanyl-D-alanine carboxypeptidase
MSVHIPAPRRICPADARRRRSAALAACLAVCLAVLLSPCRTAASAGENWPTLNDLEGNAWIVIDGETGKVMIEHQADLPLYPASTTKIMTAVIALESGKLDQVVTVSEAAVDLPAGSSKAGFLAGEQVALTDVMYGLLLASGNDAANIIAEALAGSQEAFATMMNEKAESLGMTGSHFMNPSGLQDPAHVVTARDMARLAAYAMKNAKFCEIVSTRSYSLAATNMHPFSGWAVFGNTNRLVLYGDIYYKSPLILHFDGIKTGSTNDAGNNLIAAATSTSGQKLISVLLGVPLETKTGNIYMYSRTLLEEAARLGGATQPTTSETSSATTSATTAETTAPTQTETLKPTEETTATSAETSPPDTQEDGTIFWRSTSIVLVFIWMATVVVLLLMMERLQRKYRNKNQNRRSRLR